LNSAPALLTDFRDDLPSIDVPTLVVHGSADRILPITTTGGPRLQQAVKGSRLLVIDGAPMACSGRTPTN
jgi:non-heme chloroperoxidase